MAKQPAIKAVVDKLVDFIQGSDIRVGTHLPSERQLAERLCESRGQIRTAIKELEHNGMVETIPQVGTILKSKTPCVATFQKILHMGSVDLQSLIEVRISLEITAAKLAAKRATADDIRKIEEACRAYEHETEAVSPWHEENIRFHMAIIHASQNSAIVAIMENLLNDAVVYTWSRQSGYSPARLERSVKEHQAIVDAIKRHDEDEAEQVMRFHMREMSAMVENLSHMED